MPRLPIRTWFLLWLLSAAALLCAKWSMLGEPHYWDAIGCYVPQARELARHRLDLASYLGIAFVRPPLFTGLLAAVMLYLSEAREALRVVTILWVATALPAAFAICGALGGGRRTATLAMLLTAATPIFFAQAGMVQTDLPAAALGAWAWALLLHERRSGFALVASLAVLTKESAFFLCVPAALLMMVRRLGLVADGRSPPLPLSLGRLLGAALLAWPAAVPCLVLCLWLLLHRRLTGHFIAEDHQALLFSLQALRDALLHNFVESGRPLLLGAAGLVVWPALRHRLPQPGHRREILLTAFAIVALPFLFCAGLARYMLLSLPLLCPLAARGLQQLRSERRLAAALALLGLLVAGWHGESWHHNSPDHLETSLAYQPILALHKEAARALAAEKPRAVLAGFPFFDILIAPPADGYLPMPVATRTPRPHQPLPDPCQFDFFIEGPGSDLRDLHDLLAGRQALTLWKRIGSRPGRPGSQRFTLPWAQFDQEIRIYRVACQPLQPSQVLPPRVLPPPSSRATYPPN